MQIKMDMVTLINIAQATEVTAQDIDTVEQFLRNQNSTRSLENVPMLINSLEDEFLRKTVEELAKKVQQSEVYIPPLEIFLPSSEEERESHDFKILEEIIGILNDFLQKESMTEKLVAVILITLQHATENHLKMASLLLTAYASGAKDIANSNRLSPLLFILNSPRYYEVRMPAIQYLIAKKIGINDQSESGATPLHLAIYNRQFDIATQLVQQGAYLLVKDNNRKGRIASILYGMEGQTPLEMLYMAKEKCLSAPGLYPANERDKINALLTLMEPLQAKQALDALFVWANTQMQHISSSAHFGQERLAELRSIKEKAEAANSMIMVSHSGMEVTVSNSKDIQESIRDMSHALAMLGEQGPVTDKGESLARSYLLSYGKTLALTKLDLASAPTLQTR